MTEELVLIVISRSLLPVLSNLLMSNEGSCQFLPFLRSASPVDSQAKPLSLRRYLPPALALYEAHGFISPAQGLTWLTPAGTAMVTVQTIETLPAKSRKGRVAMRGTRPPGPVRPRAAPGGPGSWESAHLGKHCRQLSVLALPMTRGRCTCWSRLRGHLGSKTDSQLKCDQRREEWTGGRREGPSLDSTTPFSTQSTGSD